MSFVCPPNVETVTQFVGDTKWIGIRARGAEWSWLTPAEAEKVGQHWAETCAKPADDQ